MSTPTEIANLSLSHLGVGKEIANIETEQSQEALAMRRFYTIARQATLRDFHWPFANVNAALALVEENPDNEWGFSYRYPVESIKLKRIWSGIRNDTRQSRVPFKIIRDTAGRLIYSDQINACIEYTYDEIDSQRFTPDFVQALSFRLAAYTAPRLTSGDPFSITQRTMQMYGLEITRAQATAVNEEQDEEKPDAEWTRARDGGSQKYHNANNASTYIWPGTNNIT